VIRFLLFLGLAAALMAFAFWIYLRVELSVEGARRLAVVRSIVLVTILALLFDPRLPSAALGGVSGRWVLLDASLSMSTVAESGASAWSGAEQRAAELALDGWRVMRFGGSALTPVVDEAGTPDRLSSLLAPALVAAAEGGAREVRILSDMRFADVVAIRSAVADLPVNVTFESFGGVVDNSGIGHFLVPDVLQPDGIPVAELEIFGGTFGDSINVVVFEEDQQVATVTVPAPSAGYRSAVMVDLPAATEGGRVRYTAAIQGADAFSDDQAGVSYANIGHEAGALVLLSLRPDWEPRYLLPVLAEVTGLSAAGYLRAGPDRYVRLGGASDRGAPADSVSVQRAATDAAILVVHGLGEDVDPWVAALLRSPGRRLVLPVDAAGAGLAGLPAVELREGEWYASPDIPTSPIAGALAGVVLGGLPPLSDVLVPEVGMREPPLQLQLRGAGSPQSAFQLIERPEGRVAIALASGTWRWAMRENGREPYRRLWSGLAGWLLSDQRVAAAEARPRDWVIGRGEPVEWSLPGDTTTSRIRVLQGDSVVVDTTVASGSPLSTGVLAPDVYTYEVTGPSGDTLAAGRFDVSPATSEMLPAPVEPEVSVRTASALGSDDGLGRPLRTTPWPYLLVIILLCGEWVVRRRSGLR
jgi:hypothetical protein